MAKGRRTTSKNDSSYVTTQQLNALHADVTALRTAFNTLVTKLNADAGVTDTNYAAAAAMTAETVEVLF